MNIVHPDQAVELAPGVHWIGALDPHLRRFDIILAGGTLSVGTLDFSNGDVQIGGQLKSGIRHDGRAPDYDDWTLNCDILFWHKALGCALELSSMGIRVDPAAMTRQLEAAGFAGAAFMDKDEVKIFAQQ